MKKYILIAICCLGMHLAYGQKTVSADSLKYYEGEVIRVGEKVYDTFMTKGQEKTTFLSFGRMPPQQKFTVVIFQEHVSNFSYNPAEYLKGKNVYVIGDVRMSNGLPEIIVEREDQIRIKE